MRHPELRHNNINIRSQRSNQLNLWNNSRDRAASLAVAVIATIERPPFEAFEARIKSTEPPSTGNLPAARNLRIDLPKQVNFKPPS